MSSYYRYGWWALAFSLVACGGKPSVSGEDEEGRDGKNETQEDAGVTGRTSDPGDDVIEPDVDPQADGGTVNGCDPTTCAELSAECGPIPDGCGGVLECGGCSDGEFCGIIEHNRCTDPSTLCVPIDEEVACAGKACGKESDGCQGVYDCGSCEGGEACGVVAPFQCDVPLALGSDGDVHFSCVPLTAEEACAGKECGLTFDGCGATAEHQYDCAEVNGGCATDEWCGILEAFQCDPATVGGCDESLSCADLGWGCGMAVDDCGNVLDCGAEGLSCNAATETCVGGVDGPAQCVVGGGQHPDDCEVCESIPTHCAAPTDTKITGRVITPGKNDNDTANQVGVPNTYVYILRNRDASQLPTISQGIPTDGGMACERCEDEDLGPALVSTITDSHGNYTLAGNIPVDEDFLLVVKIGKWRRVEQVKLNADRACQETVLETTRTRLPRSRQDGFNSGQGTHIPRMAISTGAIDAMECVFYKMGVSSNEFVHPGSGGQNAGRIHMYRGGNSGGSLNGYGGTLPSGSPVDDSVLYENKNRVFSYDMLVFDCEGAAYSSSPPNGTHRSYVREYVNAGGRMFASHLRHQWFHGNGNAPYDSDDPLATGLAAAASFDGNDGASEPPGNGYLHDVAGHQHQDKMQRYRDWLINENAVTQSGSDYQLDINDARMMFSSVDSNVEKYVLTRQGSTRWEQQFAFNTPYGAPSDAICGRVAYSAFHVSAAGGSSYTPFSGRTFPAYCDDLTGQSLNDQEKTLLYMLFDLAACVSTDIPDPPSCTPVSDCTGRCGPIPDGCGGIVNCEGCPDGESCLNGGVCSGLECVPSTCEAQGAECGFKADGCGGVLECGPCPEGHGCGVLVANQCDPLTTCPPRSCEDADAECGTIGDGCGGVRDCGQCPAGELCGVVQAHRCDPPPACVPTTCEAQGAECGNISDGCSDVIDCGPCPGNGICGAVKANQCFTPRPVPK